MDKELILARRERQAGALRVMTYNVHSCIGTDGKLSVERIAQVIEQFAADVVCLQELDVGHVRTGTVDQAGTIADLLNMQFCFHPARSAAQEHYGDAVLSRHPLQLIRAGSLPELASRPGLEPRGALWVSITIDNVPIHFFNTHLGLLAKERQVQINALLSDEWFGHRDCCGPVIFCGDLNAWRGSGVYGTVSRHLSDAQRSLRGHWPRPTFPSQFPIIRIDHVFTNQLLEVTAVHVPKARLIRTASDHLPPRGRSTI